MVTPRVADLPAALSALPAHGVGSRQDLPLPFTALVIGAAFALVVSFVALGVLWHEPRLGRDDGIPLPRWAAALLDSRVLRAVAVVLTLALTAWTLTSLVLGRDDANNPVPYVVYVWLWVGLAALSLVLGPVWSVVNPVRWLHRGITALARLDPDSALTDWSPGYWPAAFGLFAFTWLELVAPDRTTLPVLRVAIGAYVLLDLMGALVLGTAWFPGGTPSRCGRGSTAAQPPRPPHRPSVGGALPAARPQRAPGRARAAGDGRRHARRHGVRRLLRRAALVRLGAELGAACAAAADRRAAAHVRGGGPAAVGGRAGQRPAGRGARPRPGRPVRALARADRRGLPRRALLVALGLRGAEHPDPAQRPAGHRRRPARHRTPDPRRDPHPAHPGRHDPGRGDRDRSRARHRPGARAAPSPSSTAAWPSSASCRCSC